MTKEMTMSSLEDQMQKNADDAVHCAAQAQADIKGLIAAVESMKQENANLRSLVNLATADREQALLMVKQAEHERDNALHRAVLAEEVVAGLENKVLELEAALAELKPAKAKGAVKK